MTAKPESLEPLEAFTADRKGWKLFARRDDPVYAGRMFEYHDGTQALLSLRPVGFAVDGTPRLWSAQINELWSAGPTVSIETRRIGDCESWIGEQERTLEVPLTLAECRTYQQAEQVVEGLRSNHLALLVRIFGIDGALQTSAVTRHKLICACCPVVRREVRSR